MVIQLKIKLVATLIMLSTSGNLISAQPVEPDSQDAQRRGIGFVCASPSLLQGKFAKPISSLLREHGENGIAKWGDRAVAVDLGGPAGSEFLVPLSCGATGNCTWGVLADSPPRSLGVIGGAFIRIRSLRHGWAELESFSHLGAGEGSLETFVYQGSAYHRKSVGTLKPEAVDRYMSCVDNSSCCL
jgi:hypothetical protein